MPLTQPKAFGLSVVDARSQLGWGQQSSSLTIKLVNDPLSDAPFVPDYGSPCYFQIDGFRFGGLLQSFTETRGTDGLYYEANIVDPREILDGVKIITAGYAGSVSATKNLINAYGYLENIVGFGASASTPAGMPWVNVLTAINAVCNQPTYGPYGGPLTYRGFAYSINLAELPVPPAYYRVPSGHVGLLEVIAQICDDCGSDFFVELVGMTIKVRVVSRLAQPPLGTIVSLTQQAAFSGLVVRSEAGVECRNEETSAFLVGGEKTGVEVTSSFFSYWGTDVNGLPVVGEAGVHAGFGACEFMNLPAMDVADVVGSPTYRSNTVEIRAALQGPEAWGLYVGAYRPELRPAVGAELYGLKNIPFAPNLAPDVVRDDADVVNEALDPFFQRRRERLFDLVRRAGEDFYGKQYLVQMPFVVATQDPETFQITTTLEPAQSGWMEFGSATVGVPGNRQDVLQDADERVLPFAFYATVVNADTSRISWGETAVDAGGRMWVRATVSNKIHILPGALPLPCAHIKLSGALFDIPAIDNNGRALLFGPNLAVADLNKIDANAAAAGTLGHADIYPAARSPAAFGVPLKSNIETYGPWFVVGAPGKVRFEQDSTLTPWDYGGRAAMELAGQARVINALSNQQLSESGGLTVVGLPAYSMGDTLMAGGPNLTNVEVSFGQSGVTTSYRFRTFTPKVGLFARQNAEKMRRTSLSMVEARRQMRKALNKAFVRAAILDKAWRGAKANRAFWQKKQSPHSVLLAQAVPGSGSLVRTGATTETYEEGIALLNASGEFGNKAMASLSAVVRGFTTDSMATGLLPRYNTPHFSGLGGWNSPILNQHLDPYQQGSDIEVLSWGSTYQGAHAHHRGNESAKTQGLALRGPVTLTAYGYGVDGKEYPNTNGSTFVANHRRRSDLWKTGNLDLLWDDKRGVWTCHDIMDGVATSTIAPGGTGTLLVGGSGSTWTIPIVNPGSGTVPSSGYVVAGYASNRHKWVVLKGARGSATILDSTSSIACVSGNIVFTKVTKTLTGEDLVLS